MIAAGEVVEVPDVEAKVGLAVEPQEALVLERRRLAPRRPIPAAIVEAEHTVGLRQCIDSRNAAGR